MKLVASSLLLLCLSFAYSADFTYDSDLSNLTQIEKKGIIYHDQFSLGFRLNTNGWGLFGDIGKQLTVDKIRMYRIEFMELKHPKEFKQPSLGSYSPPSSSTSQSKPFFYGKRNNFYVLHFSYGFAKILAEKPLKNGVALSYNYLVGPSIGLLKPYYLSVKHEDIFLDERYDPANPQKFLDPFSIYGASGFSYGLNELSILPGIHGKFGISFDWAVYDDIVKVIEITT